MWKGSFLALNVRKDPFTSFDVMKGSFLTFNERKGPFTASESAGVGVGR